MGCLPAANSYPCQIMTLLVDTGYVRPPQHQPARTALGPACDCSAVAMNQSLLVVLATPWRYFSSSHWFHICEYYLPHQSARERRLASQSKSNVTVYIQVSPSGFETQQTYVSNHSWKHAGTCTVEIGPCQRLTRPSPTSPCTFDHIRPHLHSLSAN